MNNRRRASDRWDSTLARFGEGDVERLYSGQRARGLVMHDRPVCTVARPHFVDKKELSRHQHVVKVLSNALRKARDHLIADRQREAEHLGRYYDWILRSVRRKGQLAGFLTPLSEAEIVNVARGGSVVPAFVVGR